MFDFTFGQELERKLVEKSKMNSVTKVNYKLPEEPKFIVLTIDEFKKIVDQLSAYSDFYYKQTGVVNKEITLLFLDLFEKLKKVEKLRLLRKSGSQA
jgi:hypothetical protein